MPHVWRATFKNIVNAFIEKDYHLKVAIENVNPISDDTAEQIKDYIDDYGEELLKLPEATWDSSVYICYVDYWYVLVDLFTKESGLSDLVLNAEVRLIESEYIIEVKLVYVP